MLPRAMETTPLDWNKITDESIGWFKDLLRIDTTNPPGNERPAADFIARILEREGIRFEIHESEPTRASIVARLEGSGKKGPLLLNGHLDVVPADPQHWDHDPFAATEADGCIWGRGAIDMKNMVTMGLMSLVLLKRQGVQLERDVIFAGVADEEAGSNQGALFLVDKHPDLVRADYVLNEVGGHTLYMGEERFYPIQVSEKGICWFEITAEGEPGHGSMPHANNAVVRLARAIAALGRTRLPQHNTPVVEDFLRTLARGAPFPQNKLMPLLLEPRLAGRLLDVIGKQNPDQAMGINAMLRNTTSPTMLSGGRKVNVIPSLGQREGRRAGDPRTERAAVPRGSAARDWLRPQAERPDPTRRDRVFLRHTAVRHDLQKARRARPRSYARAVHDPRLHRFLRLREAGRGLLRLFARQARP